MFALLMSGVILSAQSFTDNGGKMSIESDQICVPHVKISESPNTPSDIVTSFGTWWSLLKLYQIPGIGINISNDEGTDNKDLHPQNQDRRVLPPLPGPYRYRSVESRGNPDMK